MSIIFAGLILFAFVCLAALFVWCICAYSGLTFIKFYFIMF